MNKWTDSAGFAREAAKVESRGEAVMLALMWPERDGWNCVTQYPLAGYRIDIAVPEAHLAVEINSIGAHGSAAAMAHDAKRRTVLALEGWITVELPAQDVFLRGGDMLIQRVMPLLAMGLPSKQPPRPNPSPAASPMKLMGSATSAAAGRALLATLAAVVDNETLRLSISHRVLANRRPEEYVGIELLCTILDFPALLDDEHVECALAFVEGPVALACAAIRLASRDGVLDQAAFLSRCPAILYPVAVNRFAVRGFDELDLARETACLLVERLRVIGGARWSG